MQHSVAIGTNLTVFLVPRSGVASSNSLVACKLIIWTSSNANVQNGTVPIAASSANFYMPTQLIVEH